MLEGKNDTIYEVQEEPQQPKAKEAAFRMEQAAYAQGGRQESANKKRKKNNGFKAVVATGLICSLIGGGIGGVVGAALLGVLYALAMNKWGGASVSPVNFAIICGAGGMISQVGDLCASAIKRNKDIKDYGKLIPGHGGILDRFDSVIFTAPLIYALLFAFA